MQANAEHEIFAWLRPVCKRQETAVLLQEVGRAMLWGLAVAGLAAVLWRVAMDFAWAGLPAMPRGVPVVVAIAALALSPLAGLWLALRHKRDWHAAAVAVDGHYRLHDRTVTGLEFLAKSERKPLEERQIVQCMEHLEGVDAKAVVRLAVSRFAIVSAFFVVLCGAAIAFPLVAGPIARRPIEPEPKPAPATAPAGEQTAPDRAATAPGPGAAADWQVAPSGEVKVSRAALAGAHTLEEIVFGPDASAGLGQTDGQPGRTEAQGREAQTVLEGEPIPLEYRRTVRRYFESIRPRDFTAPEGDSGATGSSLPVRSP
jgi:hypothetical protein